MKIVHSAPVQFTPDLAGYVVALVDDVGYLYAYPVWNTSTSSTQEAAEEFALRLAQSATERRQSATERRRRVKKLLRQLEKEYE